MGIKRPFWEHRLKEGWKKAPIIWLAGVRRTGKTTLVNELPNSTYINCDLLSVQQEIKDPERFLKEVKTQVLVLDEIHQLEEASMVLKIAADMHKHLKIIATGSSTITASKKFKDTLTGRKRNVHFVPVLVDELINFDQSLKKRILHGGLPQALLSEKLDSEYYTEWLDSFYARDIQELFAIDKRQAFLKTLEYLLVANGTQLDVNKLAQASGVSRPTAIKYLEALELTKAVSIIRPFSSNPEQEIVSQPKVYGFDTGFYCHVQNIKELRNDDCGVLLENLTLETMQANGLGAYVKYWRNKSQKEMDFVLVQEKNVVTAIECKWKENNFNGDAFGVFRNKYTKGENWVVTSDSRTRKEKLKNMSVQFINIMDLHKYLEAKNL